VDGLLDWYLLGVAAGLALAAGLGARATRAPALLTGALLAALGALAVVAFALELWAFAVPAVAGLVGRWSLRGLTAAALPAAFLGAAALAAVPVLGYLEVLAAPVLGRRLASRAGTRYAGLRILAKD
jgi:hypothetical protein